MSSLSDYLDGLGQEGQFQSEGGITLNLEKARRKLESHRLEAPHHYVLPLISAARLSGATVADCCGDFENLVLDFDGRPFSLEELGRCLDDSPVGREREISVALMALVSVSAQRILVVSTADELLNVLELCEGEPRVFQLQKGEMPAPKGTRIEVVGATVRETQETLWKFLAHRCSYTTLVTVRGRRVHYPRKVNTCALLRFRALRHHLDDPAVSATAWMVGRTQTPGFSGQVWMSPREVSVFTFILNGVAYTQRVMLRSYNGLQGVFTNPDLRLDISRSGVVEDKALNEMLALVERRFEELILPQVWASYRSLLGHRKVANHFLALWSARCESETARHIRRKLGLTPRSQGSLAEN